jgi:hypothetical protein
VTGQKLAGFSRATDALSLHPPPALSTHHATESRDHLCADSPPRPTRSSVVAFLRPCSPQHLEPARSPSSRQPLPATYRSDGPHKSGSFIVGYGSLSNCVSTSTAKLTIQRWTGLLWKDYATGTAHQGYDIDVRQNCSSTGTQTWRTLNSVTTIGGDYLTKASNELRVSCGGNPPHADRPPHRRWRLGHPNSTWAAGAEKQQRWT